MRSVAFRLFVSVTVACAAAWLAFISRTHDFHVTTDIVGYPTFANFNIDRYLWAYASMVVVLPVVTLGAYLALTRMVTGSIGQWGPRPKPVNNIVEVPRIDGPRAWSVAIGRTSFVGLVLGLQTAIYVGKSSEVVVSVAFVYGAGTFLAAYVATRRLHHEALRVVSALNILAAPVTVVGLYGASAVTEVTVSGTQVVHEYPWLPAWLAFGAAALLLVALGLKMRRAMSRAAFVALERRVLLLVVAPVAVFLAFARLPGALGPFNSFEEGQVVEGAELVRDGAFPWRDLLMAHGVTHDVAQGLVGLTLFDDSYWGLVAGQRVVIEPLVWVGVYYLCVYLFSANWLYLLGTQLLVVSGHLVAIQARFIFLPFVLLLLASLLEKGTAVRAAAFTSLLAIQVVGTPEALSAAAACLGTLVLFEAYYYERGMGIAAAFARVWRCLATVAVLAVGWLVFLGANHALDDWAFSFTALISGHQLTGGIRAMVAWVEFEVVAPIIGWLVAVIIVVARTKLRRPLTYRDWIMVAMAGVTLLYYPKFLSRADKYHLDQAFAVVVPLGFYLAYRAITFGEQRLAAFFHARSVRWFPARHSLTLPLLIVLLVGGPIEAIAVARAVPAHFDAEVPRESEVPRIGYDIPGQNDIGLVRDVSAAIRSLIGPGDTVFDFSNAPGLVYYVLDLPASNRYYHVSLAIRQRTQTDLVRLLEKHRPAVVVFAGDALLNVPRWDGVANQVRHYDVSQYLLDHYVPVLDSHGFVLMQARDTGVRTDRDLYFQVDPCDWGFVPNFFASRPLSDAAAARVPLRQLNDPTRYELTLPSGAAEYNWLEVQTAKPLVKGRFELNDRPTVGRRRSIAFNTLDRGATAVRVKVGACSQWHGYRPGVLYLSTSVQQDIRAVRLVR